MRSFCSSCTTALVPSGVKYRLYGRVTGIGRPGSPVVGSMGTSSLAAEAVTYSVLRSHDGTTCWETDPALYRLTTCIVAWSMTSTQPAPFCAADGTYTYCLAPATLG